ncbi:hypothetical protein [Celeribacter litoreus]|uniref:hypothetical protein n=1 Tax=Celeribacter litoreus TaxID=2876714 RepID=UPI001CCE5C9A|nr:hypothetical protein [Celeribacter litoreus]MCA0045265.1 hypothetical protein [Celeribacter litoreus]
MKPSVALLPLTVLSACQMSEANEVMRGMTEERRAVANETFKTMETEDLSGMLLLSEKIADECSGIYVNNQTTQLLSSRVERAPFLPVEVKAARLAKAEAAFDARHGLSGVDADICAAASMEITEMTPLGATLIEGPVL